LFEKCAPRRRRTKARRPEELTDPVTSKLLGIQENDLWIAAQAFERRFVLVSNDAMNRIASIFTPEEFSVEDWGRA